MKMKMLIVVVFTLALQRTAQAQLFKEWFRQKKTQKEYLLKQIAELRIYLSYLQKGYQIVESGINTVRDIKNGEFSLHDLYYASLKRVNPEIRKLPQAASVVENTQYIFRATDDLIKVVETTALLNESQSTLINIACPAIRKDAAQVADALLAVLTDRSLQLTDDERIARVQQIYEYSLQQTVLVKDLCSNVYALTWATEMDNREAQTIRNFYGLK
ncbi:hypothetical protein [Chitinophaga defluvii]|uniref:TerB family tellurite resistance protein n=1 Tax=Chitinophaga defluvii TaxID=3163343 RepID=A0ABV2T8Q2_9BACT